MQGLFFHAARSVVGVYFVVSLSGLNQARTRSCYENSKGGGGGEIVRESDAQYTAA